MSVPMQVWAPLCQASPFDPLFLEDMARAEQLWQGETFLWLQPKATEITRWKEAAIQPLPDGQAIHGWFRHVILPAHRANVITVHHVDEQRKIFPPVLDTHVGALPEAFYTCWLHTPPRLVPVSGPAILKVPRMQDGLIRWRAAYVAQDCMPFWARVDLPQGAIQIPCTPLGADHDPMVCLEREAQRWVPLREETTRAGEDELEWPAPFNRLFSLGSTIVLADHFGRLRQHVSAWRHGTPTQKDAVFQNAEMWVSRFTSEKMAMLYDAWYLPKVMANPQAALWDVSGKFGVEVQTIEDVQASEELMTQLGQSVSVRRVYGWLGYFWWEFYQDLRDAIPTGVCQRCGNIIRGGHKDRQYCTQQENPDCHRKRTRARQRKHRAEG